MDDKTNPALSPDRPDASPHNPGTYGFQFRRVGELEIRPPQWLVRDLLETDSLTLLFGDPAVGKSFIGLDLALCIATGTPFHGRPVVQPGLVLYVAGEGHNGVARRIEAWSRANGIPRDNIPLLVSTLPAALCDADMMATVGQVVANVAEKVGAPRLIVLDTWSRNIGGDENSSADTASAISAADRLRGPWRAAALVIHHVGHGDKGRARGSTVLRGAVDLELRVERGSDEVVRVDCTKAKDIPPPLPMAFRLEDVELGFVDETGRKVNSAVLVEEEFRPEPVPKVPVGKNQRKAFEVLRAEIERHRVNVIASGRDASEAQVSIEAWRDACATAGIDRKRFSEVKNTLEAAGAIWIEGVFVDIVLPSGDSVRSVRRPPPLVGADTDGQDRVEEFGQDIASTVNGFHRNEDRTSDAKRLRCGVKGGRT